MPATKKPKRKSKKAAALEAARVEAEERLRAQELEDERRREELLAREASIEAQAQAVSRREAECSKREEDVEARAKQLESEVVARSRSAIAAAEVRVRKAEARASEREAACADREAQLAKAENTLMIRKIEVDAREAALGDKVVGGIAERLNKLLQDQAESRDSALSRRKELEAMQADVEAREAAIEQKIADAEARVAAFDDSCLRREKQSADKLAREEHVLKQKLRRRVSDAEQIADAHRAECEVRDRQLKARAEEITRRNRELVLLSRKARKFEKYLKDQYARLKLQWDAPTPEPHPEDDLLMPVPKTTEETGFYRPTAPPFTDGTEVPSSPSKHAPALDQFQVLADHIDAVKADIVDELRNHPQHDDARPPNNNNAKAPRRPLSGRLVMQQRPRSATAARKPTTPGLASYRPHSARAPPKHAAPGDAWRASAAPPVSADGGAFVEHDDEDCGLVLRIGNNQAY